MTFFDFCQAHYDDVRVAVVVLLACLFFWLVWR